MIPYQKITVNKKAVHCYRFSGGQAMFTFDHTNNRALGRFNPGEAWCALSIHPLMGEHSKYISVGNRNADGTIPLPEDGYLNNSVCLFFSSTSSIDRLIEELQTCKKRLFDNILAVEREAWHQRQEELRQKRSSPVIDFTEWRRLNRAQ